MDQHSEDSSLDTGAQEATEGTPVRARQLEPGADGRGRVVLAATPIGSSLDASDNLKAVLAGAEVIAAEDTRRLVTLLRRLGVRSRGRIISYFDQNEASRTPELVAELEAGSNVVVATDAGMPSVSDPGYRLVQAAVEQGLEVTCVPGPSAVLTALAVSGLPVDRFCFEGFLPRQGGPRRRRLAELAAEPRTMVFFEAPHRLADFLTDCAAELGADRPAAVCRELTKPHEQVARGSLAELAERAEELARGEICVVVQGREQTTDATDALALVQQRIAQGEKLSAAVAEVAQLTGANRKQLYQAALDAKGTR
ncbi:16S rRNA (cytidine(1402)-2'-O)-methyltransferase [Luteococcus peritonei]|uniref:Ribosomal RNA small subunit methyltransferase I n=1 Tax=Luteococcus peritonei TaxID=88874 RepID=A0ABW4RZ29_9ACTN